MRQSDLQAALTNYKAAEVAAGVPNAGRDRGTGGDSERKDLHGVTNVHPYIGNARQTSTSLGPKAVVNPREHIQSARNDLRLFGILNLGERAVIHQARRSVPGNKYRCHLL